MFMSVRVGDDGPDVSCNKVEETPVRIVEHTERAHAGDQETGRGVVHDRRNRQNDRTARGFGPDAGC
jgi:hypothetical protein